MPCMTCFRLGSIPRKNRCGLSKCMENGKQTSTHTHTRKRQNNGFVPVWRWWELQECRQWLHKNIAAEVPWSFCMFYVRSKQIGNNLTYTANSQHDLLNLSEECSNFASSPEHVRELGMALIISSDICYSLQPCTWVLPSCLEIDWWQVIFLSSKYSDMCREKEAT